MAIGLSLVALGYVVIAFAVYGLGAMDKVSMFWLIGLYVIHTMGRTLFVTNWIINGF